MWCYLREEWSDPRCVTNTRTSEPLYLPPIPQKCQSSRVAANSLVCSFLWTSYGLTSQHPSFLLSSPTALQQTLKKTSKQTKFLPREHHWIDIPKQIQCHSGLQKTWNGRAGKWPQQLCQEGGGTCSEMGCNVCRGHMCSQKPETDPSTVSSPVDLQPQLLAAPWKVVLFYSQSLWIRTFFSVLLLRLWTLWHLWCSEGSQFNFFSHLFMPRLLSTAFHGRH